MQFIFHYKPQKGQHHNSETTMNWSMSSIVNLQLQFGKCTVQSTGLEATDF